MQVIRELESFKADYESLAISLGNFDGCHLGHQALISNLLNCNAEKKAIMTFGPHPVSLFNTIGSEMEFIAPGEQRLDTLAKLNIDYLFVVPFTEKFSKIPYQRFIKYLTENLRASQIVVGFNYNFGYKGKGNAEILKEMESFYGYEAVIVPPINVGSITISSSLIKDYIKQGKIKQANAMLGRSFTIKANVVKGKGRGKEMGFPTANLEAHREQVMPKNGVYDVNIFIDGNNHRGILNVGCNPTFGDAQHHMEVNIFEFDDNIYGKTVTVQFNDFIRPEQKFDSKEQLIERIKKDINIVIKS